MSFFISHSAHQLISNRVFGFLSQYLLKVVSALLILLFSITAFADVTLPAPQTKEGMGLFDALKKRSSTPGGDFPTGQLSDEELSTVLWAASGLNRGQKGWTIPMAKGRAPYVRIYVANEKGVFLYEWEGQLLREISQKDIRADISTQGFARRAADMLIFVPDSQALANLAPEKANNFSQIAVGAMSQNIYLTAAALKLSVRYIHSVKTDTINEELKLPENSNPIGIILLSK